MSTLQRPLRIVTSIEKTGDYSSHLMNPVEKAISIALCAHQGQLDLDGNPVILHPLTVGLWCTSPIAQMAGFLHDVVEDTDYTFDALIREGIPTDVIEALRLLTHSSDEPYEAYISRIINSGNAIAQEVKMNDLRHNLERGIAGGHTRIVAKHTKARQMFIDAGLWQ